MLPHGILLWFVGVRPVIPVVGVGGIANMDGVPGVERLRLGIPIVDGEMLGVGTTNRGLTPLLPISTDPNGIPDRETALCDNKGADAADVLLEAAPHVARVVPVPIVAPPPS
jgi:hypothetical protein